MGLKLTPLAEDRMPRVLGLVFAVGGMLIVEYFGLHAAWLFVAIVVGWLFGSVIGMITVSRLKRHSPQ
jgi:membrane protein YdbS with pleckstrin-like domain